MRYPAVYDQVELKGLDKENISNRQFNKFMQIARSFGKRYVHDIHYVHQAIKDLYYSKDGPSDPYSARESLVKLMDNPHRFRHTNCLASATYISHAIQKLGIPHNILIFFSKEDNFEDYHGVVLYRCQDQLLVCDLYMGNQYPELAEAFLHCPYKDYAQFYEILTNTPIDLEYSFIYDTNIYPYSGPAAWTQLSQWSPEKFGFFSKEKHTQVYKQLETLYYERKFRGK